MTVTNAISFKYSADLVPGHGCSEPLEGKSAHSLAPHEAGPQLVLTEFEILQLVPSHSWQLAASLLWPHASGISFAVASLRWDNCTTARSSNPRRQ